MPRYFFDVRNRQGVNRDKNGVVLPDVSYVWEIAGPIADEVAVAKHHTGARGIVSVIVRDDFDTVVYRSDHVTD